MDNPLEERAPVTPSSETLLHIQRQTPPANNTDTGDSNGVNIRGVIIAVCLLVLAIAIITVLLVKYYRLGRCFKRPRLFFTLNVLRDLKSIQLEIDPPFTVSGMMNTMGNHKPDRQFQYRNMRMCEEDFYPTVEERH
ncbi:small integral membrane protein 35-like [Heptranchias perlo]|uniref:small integral membrane protein 35-like n=1 Tax=Heptranchias perlo TaxID=212740 RepID=UPI0035595C2C